MYSIANDRLRVEFSLRGGELMSILGSDGTEYLYNGDPAYWAGRAPNIFPYVGRMTEGKYRLDGAEWRMPIHGFVPTSELALESIGPDSCTLALASSEETRGCYPFEFVYRIRYTLLENTLNVRYLVENRSCRAMHFGIGGHPGIAVPLGDGGAFTDYALAFSEACSPVRVGFSADCFPDGTDAPYPLEDGRVLRLRHDLFDDDAIVLRDTARAVTLQSRNGGHAVRVDFADFPYIGFWHMPHMDAPYVCIEPWYSLPSRKGVVEDLSTQPGLISLAPGETFTAAFSIACL